MISLIVTIQKEAGYKRETLHRAVSIADRFLAKRIAAPPLDLVAITCFFLGAKIEENRAHD